MKILLHDEKTLLMTEVFNSVVFETDEGERLAVCMRDGAFEIGTSKKGSKEVKWYAISHENVEWMCTRCPDTLNGKDNPPPQGEKDD